MRSAYMSKIRQRIGNHKAKEFEKLYTLRSNFLHDGSGHGNLGGAADAALEIALELLLVLSYQPKGNVKPGPRVIRKMFSRT